MAGGVDTCLRVATSGLTPGGGGGCHGGHFSSRLK